MVVSCTLSNKQMLLAGAYVLKEVVALCTWCDRDTFSFNAARVQFARSRFANR